jgi:hypothetical protein
VCYQKFGYHDIQDSTLNADAAAFCPLSANVVDDSQDVHETSTVVSQHQRTSRRTFLQTAVADAHSVHGDNPGRGVPTRFLLDTASSRSFITEAKRRALGLKYIGQETCNH